MRNTEKSGSTPEIRHEWAQSVALQAVAFIVADEEARGGLLRMTGISPADLRHGLEDPGILGGVLGFLLANEQRLLTFCKQAALPPESPARALRQLTGGESDTHFT
ncbi:MAG: DUF3572 domain-containing protein [Sphingomonadales bacterium]